MDYEELDDDALVASIPLSASAFDAFYRRHVDAIVRYLARHLFSADDVADASANTFLAVLAACESFDPDRGSATSWLYAIARNQARDQTRARSRAAGMTERLLGRRLLSDDDITRIEEVIDAERDASALAPAIDRVRPSERAFLDHLVAHDTSPPEAARSLGIAPGAGRLRLTRLRRTVRIHAERVAAQSHVEVPSLPEDDQ